LLTRITAERASQILKGAHFEEQSTAHSAGGCTIIFKKGKIKKAKGKNMTVEVTYSAASGHRIGNHTSVIQESMRRAVEKLYAVLNPFD
jgi:hypothetical protein